jgi:addiction module HigA family antidote
VPHRPPPPHRNRAGRLLDRTLEDLDWYQQYLAQITGITGKHVNLIVKGHARITPQIALRLEAATGVEAIEWLWMTSLDQLEELRRQ